MWNPFRKKKNPLSGEIRVTGTSGVVYLASPSVISVIFGSLASLFWLVSFLIFTIPVIPRVYYWVYPDTSEALEVVLSRPNANFDEILVESGDKTVYQPPLDPNLGTENRLIIEKIGVDTPILEEPQETVENALRQGVWRVPDFGDSYDRDFPMILAAHRFGYLAWTNEYRRLNSFYNVPKLENGDQITVIWQQRKYIYEIYNGEQGTDITDYSGDLILYTCRFLESDQRIFRYARLVTVESFEQLI